MAIYENDGTAIHELGRVLDHDGTANHRLAKVYDHDGTANHLIYSAEEWLIKDGVGGEEFSFVVRQVGGSSSSAWGVHSSSKVDYNTLKISCSTNEWQKAGNIYTNRELIDLTGYDSITVRWSYSSGSSERRVLIGVTQSLEVKSDYNAFTKAAVKHQNTQFSSGGGEFTLDVSEITGEHYVYIGIGCGYSMNATVYFTELHLH